MPDVTAVDTAVVSVLAADTYLQTLCPGGVYFGVAPQGRRQFVLVALVVDFSDWQFAEVSGERRAIEDITYNVKAVVMDSVGSDVEAAAARIDAVLEDQPLTIPGYGWMSTVRTERIRYPEVDSVDQNIRWWHQGGHYRVMVTPLGEGQ